MAPPPARRRRRGLALRLRPPLALLVLGLAAAGGAQPADSPPVLLRERLFLTPAETAGTGLAPEVKVRVTVDPKGRVGDVEVLSIEPSSEFDALFREVTVETLEQWRYAPALRGGEPVEATLAWTIQFLPKARRPPGVAPGNGVLADEARLARVFILPREVQAARLKSLAALAEPHLDAGRRRRVDTPRFVVVSDAPDGATAETVAGNLEAVYGLLDEVFRPAIEPQPTPYKQVAYVYSDRASFAALTGELTYAEWSSGLYVPPGLFAFHLETTTVDALLGILVHETVHAYTDHHLARPGFPPPPWLAEGLAEYFARSEIRRGRLEPGRIREGKYVVDFLRGGAYRQTTAAGWNLERAKQAVRTGEAAGVERLVGASRDVFYGEEVAEHYALSWLLVHYLRHGEPGWAEEEFADLLLYLFEGYPADAAFEAVYGRRPAELEEPFRAYVRGL